jgi:hypothetical protein
MIARTPTALTASIMAVLILTGSSSTILPKPIYIGGGPEDRKAWRSVGGSYVGASRKKKPQTSIGFVSHVYQYLGNSVTRH